MLLIFTVRVKDITTKAGRRKGLRVRDIDAEGQSARIPAIQSRTCLQASVVARHLSLQSFPLLGR
jgi:hypothetical protein